MQIDVTNLTIDKYLNIREEVDCYLQEMRKRPTQFDLLSKEEQEKVLENANLVMKKSILIEPNISNDLINLVNQIGGTLVGFKHRIKGLESLKRKIIADSRELISESKYRDAAMSLGDGVRYTIVLDDLEYVEKADLFLHELENLGYKIVDFKNNWGKPFYQGFNIRISCPLDIGVFELQFHTPYGHQIKEGSTRDLYQVVRDEYKGEGALETKRKANILRQYFQKTVNIPPNALYYEFKTNTKMM